ncbi:hypothetical protein ABZ330_16715 [Streptomyces sp. NPDC006172]|uniref:hypothetical protein n=1 Tax=Streptomyces sp. NPDC006172 TaxID=3154470 RepID=UPI0033F687F5
MARDKDGWEYVDGAARWAPTVEVQMANILGGLYGDEYEERKRELEALVRAARRDAAEEVEAWARTFPDTPLGRSIAAVVSEGASKLYPTYPKEVDGE